jgi:uncharacterized protein YdaU (DUF1376 family)
MNFYKHYLGDFSRDTGHLSLTQRGAYLALMHHYYATEKPLPADHAALCRIAGAQDKAERAAVEVVMSFFRQGEGGLVHDRIEAELHKAGNRADTNRRIAVEREEARRVAREEHEARTNRATDRGTNREPNQTPDTRHQTTAKTQAATPLPDSPSAPRAPACPTEALIALYHDHLPMLPRVEVVSDSRKRALSARWREVINDPDIRKAEDVRAAALDWFGWFFSHAAKSRFLTGKAKDWRASLDFLLTPAKFAKVVEGSYHREAA